MMALFRAEWHKITGNRILMGCLIWIWPFLACGMVTLIYLAFVARGSGSQAAYVDSPVRWTDAALGPWQALNSVLGRLLLMGFVATVFAGEYQHGTWKTVLPGNTRIKMLLAKYVVMAIVILITFAVMMLVLVISLGAMNLFLGAGYPPALSAAVLADFTGNLLANVALGLASFLVVANIAILISIWTRSILFGVLVSTFFALVEFLGIPPILSLIADIFQWDWVNNLLVLVPAFHADNIAAWINTGEGAVFISEELEVALVPSIFALALWLLGLLAATVVIFRRQDL